MSKSCSRLVDVELATLNEDLTKPLANDDTEALAKLQREAAFCRAALGADMALVDGLIRSGEELQLSGKMRFVNAMLPKWHEEGLKVLLFSSSTRTLEYDFLNILDVFSVLT